MFAASTYIDLRRLPELFCGFSRQRSQGPTFYPVACAPQAWAAAAPLSMIQSCLGLTFNPVALQVLFNEPVLPAFLDKGLIQGGTVSIENHQPSVTYPVKLTAAGVEAAKESES
jgi:glycogen debranching enzyme